MLSKSLASSRPLSGSDGFFQNGAADEYSSENGRVAQMEASPPPSNTYGDSNNNEENVLISTQQQAAEDDFFSYGSSGKGIDQLTKLKVNPKLSY